MDTITTEAPSETRPRFNPLASFTVPPAPIEIEPTPAPGTRGKYDLALEEEWRADAPDDCTPNAILSDDDGKASTPKVAADVPPAIAKLQRETARAKRLAGFDEAFTIARAAVWDCIEHARQSVPPGVLDFEEQRAQFFYNAAKTRAARDDTFDPPQAAQTYQAARLRSLQNAINRANLI